MGGADYETKTVNIYGKEFEISYDFSYASMDEDGEVGIHKYCPSVGSISFFDSGQYLYLGKVEYTGDWKESLIEI